MGSDDRQAAVLGRPLAAVLLGCMGLLALWGTGRYRATRAAESSVTCTNPASGASWQIKVDYDRSTVDANPARISEAEITWRDQADGWNYTLDLKSGKLTVILASSTGGNTLLDRCKLGN